MASSPSSPLSPLEVPKSLKGPYDWIKLIEIAATYTSPIWGYFLGTQFGRVAAILTAILIPVGFGLRQVYERLNQRVKSAKSLIENSTAARDTNVVTAVAQLTSVLRWLQVGSALLALILLVSSGVLLYPLVRDIWQTRKPETISFQQVQFYDPSDSSHITLLESLPFLEAVIGDLTREGASETENPKVIIGWFVPTTHPTPSYSVQVVPKDQRIYFSGYGFHVVGDLEQMPQLQAIPATYADEHVTKFQVPSSHLGGYVLLVGRLSSTEKAAEVPDDLAGFLEVSIDQSLEHKQ